MRVISRICVLLIFCVLLNFSKTDTFQLPEKVVKKSFCETPTDPCPENEVCDTENKKCIPKDNKIKMWTLYEEMKNMTKPFRRNILGKFPGEIVGFRCRIENPDVYDECEEKCCYVRKSYYGCCPYLAELCCSDNLHCCHSTRRCDTVNYKCILALDAVSFDVRIQRLERIVLEKHKFSFESQSSDQFSLAIWNRNQCRCSKDQTCCPTHAQGTLCCPTKNAVCCPDKISCCPYNFHCIPGGCQKNRILK